MNDTDTEIIDKTVKDMYGTFMGNIVGTITDISGSPEIIGIDCGSEGLKQIPFEQLVFQDDTAVFIPKWRLDSQRYLKQKDLTLRKMRTMLETARIEGSEEDTAIIFDTYNSHLDTLNSNDSEIRARLESRIRELSSQMNMVKRFSFDAKVQVKSGEISQSTFDSIQRHTNNLAQHISFETTEIENIQRRMSALDLEGEQITNGDQTPPPTENFDDFQTMQGKLPIPDMPTSVPTIPGNLDCNLPLPNSEDSDDKKDNDWLSRMESQQV